MGSLILEGLQHWKECWFWIVFLLAGAGELER